ncbi:MAG: hypothetical protein JSR21_15935 [Proteobacteria bacterium]|nr:hypothetical protein [Pseudomonadota bacterium]
MNCSTTRLGPAGRVILGVVTLYALLLIAPDMIRPFKPLASFGVSMDSNGVIYDAVSPFEHPESSPAAGAGIVPGDRVDLGRMTCVPVGTDACASLLAIWGGVTFVMPGATVTLQLLQVEERPPRAVTLTAAPRPRGLLLNAVLMLDQLAGIAVVLGAAWLVWLRPGAMTWGFLAYAAEFNPGQPFVFYAFLQHWPRLYVAAAVIACVMQAAGYVGLLLFALRVPTGHSAGAWARAERALPAVFAVLLLLSLASLGNLFGFRTEALSRASFLAGFAVAAAALAILIGRRHMLAPRDYQRIRWVIWGCVIGLPTYQVAVLMQSTSLFTPLLGGGSAPEYLTGLLYLVNGVLCLFVVEAVRRRTVINVSIPLRRATLLALVLSLPAFLLHQQIEVIDHLLHLPEWAWFLLASLLAFMIARLHDLATEIADHLMDRRFARAEHHLRSVARAIQHATSRAEVDRLLVQEPAATLKLASAAVFRDIDGVLRRSAAVGWEADTSETIDAADPLFARSAHKMRDETPFRLHSDTESNAALPDDLARPILAVPVASPRQTFAMALYGSHEVGTDLSHRERALLAELAHRAESAYAYLEIRRLRHRVEALEQRAQVAPAAE